MKGLTAPAVTTTLLLNLGAVLFASGAVAQSATLEVGWKRAK